MGGMATGDRQLRLQLNPPPYPPITTRETVFMSNGDLDDVSTHEFSFERQRSQTRYDTSISFAQGAIESGTFAEDEVADVDIVYGHGVMAPPDAATYSFEFRTRGAGVLKHVLARHCEATIDGISVASGFRELNVDVENDEPVSITVRNPNTVRAQVGMFSLHVEYLTNRFEQVRERIVIE